MGGQAPLTPGPSGPTAPSAAPAPAGSPRPDAGRRIRSLPLAAALALLGLWVFAALWYPLTDTDIWWHLAAADWMVAHKAVPRVDPFAVSSLGKPWIDLHWGFQLLCRGLWSLGGAAALVAGKVLAVAAAVLLALRPHLRHDNAWFLLPLAAFGVHHVRWFVDVRPLAVTLLGLSVLYLATLAHLRGSFARPYLVLLPVQILLANMQGLYPLGAVLVTALWAGAWRDRRRGAAGAVGTDGAEGTDRVTVPSLLPLGMTCLGLWLAGFCTPYGLRGFLLPLTLLARITPLPGNVFSSEIAENQPLHALLRDPAEALPYALFLGAVLWTFLRARPVSTGHALLFAGFGLLGALAQRNLPLALLAGLMAAGRNLETRAATGQEQAGRASPWLASLLLLAIAAAYGPGIRRAWLYELPGSLETPFRFPSGAADFLEAHPLPGPIFNELRFGGYLAYRLYPETLPFVDGRMILRDADFYREFLAVVDYPERFGGYARRHDFTHALLPIGEDGRFRPLASHLLGREGWRLLYCDGAAALLAPPPVAGGLALSLDAIDAGHPVLRALEDRYGANPRLAAIARRNLEAFLGAAGITPEKSPPGP